MAISDKMLSLKEAAEFLGYQGDDALREIVDRSRAKAQGAATTGPTIRFFQPSRGSPIRFKRAWLDEFIDAHTIDPSRGRPDSAPTRRPKKRAARETAVAWSHGLNPSLFGAG